MDKTTKIIGRIVGGILVLLGIGFGALGAFAIERQLALKGTLDSDARIAAIIFLGLTIFFLAIGYRLAADKPNQYQSILPPVGWYVLMLVFAALSATFVFFTTVGDKINDLAGAFLTGLFAWWCWTAAKAARARKDGIVDAPDELFAELNGSRAGYVRLLTFRGIPIFIHRSLPLGGLMFALYAGFDAGNILYYCLGYFLLVGAHEAGHAVAARIVGLKVNSIDISGVGGLCHIETPRKVSHGVFVYSAGIAVQVILLMATVTYVQVVGEPDSRFGRSFVATFIFANAIVLFLNFLPMKSNSGLASDGQVLWGLFQFTYRGQPNPFKNYIALATEHSPIFPPETSLLSKQALIPKDFTLGVEILNDSTTSMEFVVACLIKHLALNRHEAISTMLTIHNNGGVLMPLPSLEKAEEVAAAIAADVKEQNVALVCRAVDARR